MASCCAVRLDQLQMCGRHLGPESLNASLAGDDVCKLPVPLGIA